MKKPTIKRIREEIQPLMQSIDDGLSEINELTIEITEIPAPPFNEENRAMFIQSYFELLGYQCYIDEVGNVIAYHDEKPEHPVILSAHLDTVFDNETINVKIDGNKLKAPGVGDDSRGLANLLFIAKLLKSSSYCQSIIFVATVGEEGRGDLRGVKHLFSDSEYQKSACFVTIDGTSTQKIVDQGIGSLRYRLHFKGPGGHSYGSFGTVNPLFSLADFMSNFSNMKPNKDFICTYSLGVVGGGTSINAIPEQVWVDIDLRSEKDEGLQYMKEEIFSFAKYATEKESSLRKGEIAYKFEEVGNRPAGKLKDENFRTIVELVHEELGLGLNFSPSSTDANIPMNLGIPAISVAGVENSANAHTQDEWIDASVSSLIPIKRNLLLVCSLVENYKE